MKAPYYRILLDDYSTPPFVSLGMSYYGTLEQIDGLFGEITKDAALAEKYQDILSAYGRAAGGEAGVTHYVALVRDDGARLGQCQSVGLRAPSATPRAASLSIL